jgi:hypothetical protein
MPVGLNGLRARCGLCRFLHPCGGICGNIGLNNRYDRANPSSGMACQSLCARMVCARGVSQDLIHARRIRAENNARAVLRARRMWQEWPADDLLRAGRLRARRNFLSARGSRCDKKVHRSGWQSQWVREWQWAFMAQLLVPSAPGQDWPGHPAVETRRGFTASSVVPGQTGIPSRVRGCWIPAFAGMTRGAGMALLSSCHASRLSSCDASLRIAGVLPHNGR